VLSGSVPTASGFHRHRTVDQPEASTALAWVLAAVTDSGAEPWVHTCAAATPLPLLRGAGARGLSVDLARMSAADHDALADTVEAGETVVLGVVPSVDSETTRPTDGQVAETALRWLDMVGLDAATVGDRLVLSPSCGLAGASPGWARQMLTLVRRGAANVDG
jgi:methionine synthase II (cobalamin-independent)